MVVGIPRPLLLRRGYEYEDACNGDADDTCQDNEGSPRSRRTRAAQIGPRSRTPVRAEPGEAREQPGRQAKRRQRGPKEVAWEAPGSFRSAPPAPLRMIWERKRLARARSAWGKPHEGSRQSRHPGPEQPLLRSPGHAPPVCHEGHLRSPECVLWSGQKKNSRDPTPKGTLCVFSERKFSGTSR